MSTWLLRIFVSGAAVLWLSGAVTIVAAQDAPDPLFHDIRENAGKGAKKALWQLDDDPFCTSSTSLVQVTGDSFNIPGGQTGVIEVRFSGESFCHGGGAGNWCTIQLLVDGAQARPASGNDYAFDSVGDDNDFWEGNSVERVSVPLGSGSHFVEVYARVTNAAVTFCVDDWTATATYWQK